MESSIRDDGHWGGFHQVRGPSIIALEDFEAGVLAGYGFDLLPFEVFRFCRDQVALSRWDDGKPMFPEQEDTVELMPELLVLLAHPHFEGERPPAALRPDNC